MPDTIETKTAISRIPRHFTYYVRDSEGGDNY